MVKPIRVGILGDFRAHFSSHPATNAAIQHAAAGVGLSVTSEWLPTPRLKDAAILDELRRFDGLWGAPGSPWESFDGMLRGIRFAREEGWPYLGTCAGFQYALIEYARNVLGLADADSAENESGSKNIVISPVSCALPNRPADGPKMSGDDPVKILAGTLLRQIVGRDEIRGEYFCDFAVNEAFEAQFQLKGLKVSARGPEGETRAVEIPGHRFFVATLFQPQLASRTGQPHPIILGYLKACAEFQAERARRAA